MSYYFLDIYVSIPIFCISKTKQTHTDTHTYITFSINALSLYLLMLDFRMLDSDLKLTYFNPAELLFYRIENRNLKYA